MLWRCLANVLGAEMHCPANRYGIPRKLACTGGRGTLLQDTHGDTVSAFDHGADSRSRPPRKCRSA